MKNIIKKIIIVAFAFVVLFAGSSALASNAFNGVSGDCNPALGIGVYPNIPRDSNGCWTATSITAGAGDTINVAMYYHNNTNGTLPNVSGSIVKNGSGQDYTFTGKMYSSYGTQTIGTVNLHLTSSQTLTYSSSHWMQNANAVLSDTDTQVIYNDGGQIPFGAVSTGWDNYGELLVVYKVGNTVTPTPSDCHITDFSASPSTINSGDSSSLHWVTDGCSSVSISSVGSYTNTSGYHTVYPSNSTTYTLTAYGPSGSADDTDTTHVYVNNDGGSSDCSILYFRADGSSSSTIDDGDNAVLTWDTNDCDSVSISSVGSVNDSGSKNVYPSSDRNYTLTAYNTDGSHVSKTVYVYVNDNYNNYNYQTPTPTPVYYGACGITEIATNVAKTTATLNGITSNPTYTGASTYFEYGPTQSLGLRTSARTISGNSYFSENISGLMPGTTYYFRLVSNCSNGNAYGNLSSIKTASDVIQPVVQTVYLPGKNTTTYINNGGISSPIQLKIENRFEMIGIGDNINYTITYKNIGRATLIDPVLQVVVPDGVLMTGTSDGTYSNDSHILTVPLHDLKAGDNGKVYLDAVFKSIVNVNEKIVTTASLVYTNTNKAQENATAYVLNIPKNVTGNSLGAAALFGSFFSLGLIGWLLLILLVLIIIVVARKVFQKK